MYIGRSPTFSTDDLDQIPPVVDQDVDFVEPMCMSLRRLRLFRSLIRTPADRSSGFHWSSQLMLIGSKIMVRSPLLLLPNFTNNRVTVDHLRSQAGDLAVDAPGSCSRAAPRP
mgnify:FL=1